ncbi:ImmA/IrrE family metallo-endopeptidase [Acinetobacter sp. ANC 3781]|uniref:ImmA/IrrE family metallo-endopeptidase n=1 Tax=Acinetobacter sp. ANC 3781 TaxID=2529835 RepID=UPI001039952D|nr:ImmA/IrrE family metallo-endopeptidase [Acinetobacter sp. ANC 3781]TCB79336.1 ImmA/IrrE family metallo-endopeptidase [Acinetobacter sp. ANC 3781]
MSTLNFSIDMLEWAANNIGLRLDQVVSKISEAERTQKKLLAGEFSVNQAENFADITKVPFGALFLDAPPESLYKPNIPDLRQGQNAQPLSESFYEVLEDIQAKQEWYIEFLKENYAEHLEFVGKYDHYTDVSIIASDIRKTIGLPYDLCTKKSREDYLKNLVSKCEEVGILVFKNSMVKNATKKPLNTEEFRGFVLIDKYAPVIFLNSQDLPSALIFTLAHELAHIWLGESGVDDLDFYGNDPNEVFCNKIAAEVLITKKEFYDYWYSTEGNLIAIANIFCVSKLMVARLALTYGFIGTFDYQLIQREEYEAYKNIPKKDGSPNFVNLIPGRNSYLLTKTIVNQALSGKILLRDAGKLLNASPQNIMKIGGVI